MICIECRPEIVFLLIFLLSFLFAFHQSLNEFACAVVKAPKFSQITPYSHISALAQD